MKFAQLFSTPKPIIGMLHLLPLPGTPDYNHDFDRVIEHAVQTAVALEAGGVDGILVQNRGDKAFSKDISPPEIVAAMALITHAVSQAVRMPVGVHLLRNDIHGSLAVARLCGACFIRAAAVTGVTYLPQGIVEARPTETLHVRARLAATDIAMLTDVASMHYRPFLPQSPAEVASEARDLGLADAVVIALPDEAAALTAVQAVKRVNPTLPVLLGGYTSVDNIGRLLAEADGAIVGGAFEAGGRGGQLVVEQVERFMTAVQRVRHD